MNTYKIWLTLFSFILMVESVLAQGATGVVNFNVNEPPVDPTAKQNVQLFGCNNTQISANVDWGGENQLLEVPYGLRVSALGKEYFLSKYYQASPPIPLQVSPNEKTNIGLLTPDRFRFTGSRPAQIVNFDYQILQPTYLRHVPVSYEYALEGGVSCASLGVSSIPINTNCPNFPWKNGALGAAGIGLLQNTEGQRHVFIPTIEEGGKEPLQCSVSVLNDINLDHQVFFALDIGLSETADLTAFYTLGEAIPLVCIPRLEDEIPSGCLP